MQQLENIFNIADYFLNKKPMTHKKLQRLCYFAQALHLGQYDKPLVQNQFQAWIHGPVSPDLYLKYKQWGWNLIDRKSKTITFENSETPEFLDAIYDKYKDHTDMELSNITKSHRPWKNARNNVPEDHYCANPISWNDMREYYRLEKENKTYLLVLICYFEDTLILKEIKEINTPGAMTFICDNQKIITKDYFADNEPELKNALESFIQIPKHPVYHDYPYRIELKVYANAKHINI